MSLPISSANVPVATVLLTCYNHQLTIEQAIESVFAQTYSPLEIIISDDCSKDDSWCVIQRVVSRYDGPHTVRINRNETNQGIGAHLSQLVDMASGELLFVAAGDDLSESTRCERVVAAWLAHGGKPDLIACDLQSMDGSGNILSVINVDDLARWTNLDGWMDHLPYVVGAGHTWHRRLFERFGSMNKGVRMEDQIMTFRAIVSGGAITVAEPLVKYRQGGESGRVRSFSSKALMERWYKGSGYAIAEIGQITRDANIVGEGARIARHCAQILARENYILAMYEAPNFFRRLKLLMQARLVPLRWRWRVFFHAALPWFGLPFFFVKRVLAKGKAS